MSSFKNLENDKEDDMKERRKRNLTSYNRFTCVPCHRHQDFYLGDISARVYDKTSLFHLE